MKLKLVLLTILLISQVLFSNENNVPTISFKNAFETCALTSSPGDFILQHLNGDSLSEIYGVAVVGLEGLKDILSLNVFWNIDYTHAEVIKNIKDGENFITVSFYPWIFRGKGKSEFRTYSIENRKYRKTFSVFRLKGTSGTKLHKREKALAKIENSDDYWKMGSCSDFVNWAYNDYITSWWNFIPVARTVIAKLYPPEAITSPDHLADSPYTKEVCKIEYGKVIYPETMETSTLLYRALENQRSQNEVLRSHGNWVQNKLLEKNLIDQSNAIKVEQFKINLENHIYSEKDKNNLGKKNHPNIIFPE